MSQRFSAPKHSPSYLRDVRVDFIAVGVALGGDGAGLARLLELTRTALVLARLELRAASAHGRERERETESVGGWADAFCFSGGGGL